MAKTLTVFLAADLKKFNAGMRDAEGQIGSLGGGLKNTLGPALAAAGIAAGALAIKLGVDGVKAAMEDQAAMEALATTLDNLNLAHDTQAIEGYISELERAYGVADTELRPAYDRLIRSTNDVEEANRALKIAMDISAGTGKSLETVTEALGKAYDGNTTALGRLGLGIDRAKLSSMSLDDITNTLARTFAGQADTNARTFEGQLRRLRTATDNLKEAFGAGLLESLGDTDAATQDLVDSMQDFEPVLRDVGRAFGIFTTTALKTYTGAMGDAKRATRDTQTQMAGLSKSAEIGGALIGEIFGSLTGPNSPIGTVLRGIGLASGEAADLEAQLADLANQYADADLFARRNVSPPTPPRPLPNPFLDIRSDRDLLARLQLFEQRQNAANDSLDDFSGSARDASREADTLTNKQEKLIKAADLQRVAFSAGRDALLEQIQTVEEATQAVEDYADKIQQDLLAGIDLGGLAEGAMNEEGKLSADKFFQGFDAAINQAEWFGNVLTALKARGIDQNLLEQIASLGPETGGALGQELLNGDGALLQTLNDKWVGIQDKTRELALGLVPEFLEAGRLSAIDTLNGLATQFAEDQRKFKRLGKKLGEQVGSEFKKQIAKDVAEAVRAVEAAATAARAEAVAREEARQAAITEQAVASAIANLIRNSDQRTGRNVQPVLS